jgi:hypothetical protein
MWFAEMDLPDDHQMLKGTFERDGFIVLRDYPSADELKRHERSPERVP